MPTPAPRPPGDAGEPDPTTTAGRWAYYCGVRGILNGIAAHLPKQEWPHRWEAWNEPNGGCTYLNNHCDPAVCAQLDQPADNLDPATGTYTCSATGDEDASCAAGSGAAGAAKAACLWIEARNVVVQYPGHAGDEVAAGSFSFPSTGYLAPYATLLSSQGYHPGTWAVHDYGDPTASGWLGRPVAQQLQPFASALGSQTAGTHNQLWITESGVLLTDRDRSYAGYQSIPCASASLGRPGLHARRLHQRQRERPDHERGGILRSRSGDRRAARDCALLVPVQGRRRCVGLGAAGSQRQSARRILHVDRAASGGMLRHSGGAAVSPRVALVTCAELPELGEDEPLLLDALRDRGVDAQPAVWDDAAVDWALV